MGRPGAEVGVEEVEVLLRFFVEEDLLGDAMAFDWASRRRSIDGGVTGWPSTYPGQARRERNANHASFTRCVTCHIVTLFGLLFIVGS